MDEQNKDRNPERNNLEPAPTEPTSEVSTPPTNAPKHRTKKILYGMIALALVILAIVSFVVSGQIKNSQQSNTQLANSESSEAVDNLQPAVEQSFVNPKTDDKTEIIQEKYYAVKLGDTTYYGKVVKINDDFYRISPVVYVNKTGNSQTIFKQGSELHGPDNASYVHGSQVSDLNELTDQKLLDVLSGLQPIGDDAYPSGDINAYLKADQMKSFYFKDGSIFFAKASTLDGKFLANLPYVYHLRTNSSAGGQNDVSLVKSETKQYGNLTISNLLYWQNMKSDSQISQAAAQFEQIN